MKVSVKMNNAAIKKLQYAQIKALELTAEEVKRDVIADGVIPFDTGTLQNESTTTDLSKSNRGKVSVVSDTPYARRMYFHPEYQFNQEKNPNAKGRWFDDWINGNKKSVAINAYKKFFKKLSGV